MKTFIQTLGLATAFIFAWVAGPLRAQDDSITGQTPSAQGDNDVSFQTFYSQLANQGVWINTEPYGYVFQPTESNSDWAPYTNGYWVHTDAGMTWVSYDSFGWATDHYGRWVNLDAYGWVWVPGYTWGPAWVSWREDNDGEDVGWAPLPPDSDVGIDYYSDDYLDVGADGYHIGDDCDLAYGIGPGWYNFCPVVFIGDRDGFHHLRDRRDNFAHIGHTRNVTNINFNRHGEGRFDRVHAECPSVAALNARAHTPIRTVSLASAASRDAAGLRGNTLSVYAPHVERGTVANARPESMSGRGVNATVNRGTDVNHPLAMNSGLQPATVAAAQFRAATMAQDRYPSSAKIATTDTHFSRELTQPLTSMRTSERTVSMTANNPRFNGGVAEPAREARPEDSPEPRYLGEFEHSTLSSNGELNSVGGSLIRQEEGSSVGDRRFTGETAEAVPQESQSERYRSYFEGETYHPSSVYPMTSTPAFHSTEGGYHGAAGVSAFGQGEASFHSDGRAPVFHQSTPSFHSEGIYHAAPEVHYSGGGGFHPTGETGGSRPSGGGFHGGGGGFHGGGGGRR